MTISGVYSIINIKTNDHYVGSSVNIIKRRTSHFWELKKNTHCNDYLQKSFNKYGIDSFFFEVILECDRNDCINNEQMMIDKYKNNGINLYNICNYAGSNLGRVVSDITKEKISKANKGRKLSLWQIELLRKANKGRKLTIEQRVAIGNRGRGIKMSDEVKLKISIGNKGKPKSESHKIALKKARVNSTISKVLIEQYDTNGVLINTFKTVREACISVKSVIQNMYKHFNGERKLVRGFVFKKIKI